MELFALATKKKYRFDTVKGQLTVEDLWDLPLTSDTGKPNLDDIAKALYKEIKAGEDEISFVKTTANKNTAYETAKNKLDIVKHIIDVKQAEAEAAQKAKVAKEKRQRILALLAQKEDEELTSKSREELLAMLSEDAAE